MTQHINYDANYSYFAILFHVPPNILTMAATQPVDNDFLNKITAIIQDHVSDAGFGVSELAREAGMSRSNLLRKIKKNTNLSASLFIRHVRLKEAMEMLRETSLNVSEVSWKAGFSSTSYFIKCFREYYGYPPGEAGKRDSTESSFNIAGESSKGHQLAAIMFTDIQGYTALMQRDEEKALSFRSRHREVFDSTTKKYNGRILQYYGDGTLSTFTSAIDAVKCGIKMQLAFREDPQIPVRIGIHTGDIIFTKDDIIGNGVNIASRIESLSTVGSVFISEKVYDEVKNQPGIHTLSMGIFELKNVDKPMEVFAIANKGLVVPDRDTMPQQAKGKRIPDKKGPKLKKRAAIVSVVSVIMLAVALYFVFNPDFFNDADTQISGADLFDAKKSIAVLPFINDSHDSSNVYIINGLMESILNNLQKIEDLRVISRTSVEKYRNSPKLIPEIASELNVNYFVEGSGQKIGDQILLSIQLIDASSDRHVWAEQYNRKIDDIFKIQSEVAKNIAGRIEVIITPEEKERIEQAPTENLVAYDHFLKGLEYFHWGNREGVVIAIPHFKKATQEDPGFALAYANIAISYYYMDIYQAEKKYTDSVDYYADRALLNDPKLPQSLVAKAFFFINKEEYALAVPYLEKALEYNPNSTLVINTLADFYANYMPDTRKYLEYALKGISLDIAGNDSVSASFIYLHVSNALAQAGFADEALVYVNKSLEYNPENIYSSYVTAYILYAKERDLQLTLNMLIETFNKDTTRLDVMQEIGKIYYYLRDYENAWHYNRFINAREAYNLDIYKAEDIKIGLVLNELGQTEEAEKMFDAYLTYAENDRSLYKHLSLAVYYGYMGNHDKALEHLRLFTSEEGYSYWVILFLEIDPLVDELKLHPEFKPLVEKIKEKFWSRHKQIKQSLEAQALI